MRCDIDLDFSLVDDLCLACQSAAISQADIPRATARHLGPLLELAHVAPAIGGVDIGRAWIVSGAMGAIAQRVNGSTGWYASDMHQGIARVREFVEDPLAWTAFIHRSRAGAANAGFTADHSAKLIAALGEIYSNVVEHSGNLSSGYVAYRATSGTFEFVVADRGIGVLHSLRSNPKYIGLSDSGTALELALKQGISRHTAGDRGFGFVPLFVGLANISRVVRFRTGDHAHITRRDASGNITSATRQLANCEGFFCSVLCDFS